MSSDILSDLGYSPLSHISTEIFEEEIASRHDDIDHDIVVGEEGQPVDGEHREVVEVNLASDQEIEIATMSDPAVKAEEDRLADIKDDVELSLSDLPVSRVTLQTLEVMQQRMSDTYSRAKEYALGMKKMARKFPSLEQSFKLQYAADGKSLLKTVTDHEVLLLNKIYEVRHADQPAQQGPGVPQPRDVAPPHVPQQVQQVDVNAVATIKAKAAVKYNTLLNMALTAKQDMEEDGLYLESASDEKISRLVQKISRYEKLRDKIQNSHNEYLEFTALHKPDNILYDAAKLVTAVQDATTCIDNLIKDLETEDEDRGLATLLPRKAEKMKWPAFSGNPGENFFKFKEQFFKVAKQNMTSKSDQLTKLRENLKDFPLTLVPDTTESVEAAFTRLSDTYGDPQKLVNFELKKLEKITMFPNCDDGTYTVGTRQQAEWLLQLETIIADMVKMGTDADADIDLQRSVLGPQTTNIILNKFPLILKHQLISTCKASPKIEKLQVYMDKVKEWSKQALDMEKFEPEKPIFKKSAQHLHTGLKDPQIFLFNPPEPLPSCIICVETQKKQQVSPQQLHISAHVTGCPLFIEMNMVNRDKMATALKLCKFCLRVDDAGHEKACIVWKLKNKKNKTDKTKYEFTCRDQICYKHMWLCFKHKSGNQDSMDKKAADLDQKHGYKLAHFLGCSRPSAPMPSHLSTYPSTSQPGTPLDTCQTAATSPAIDSNVFRTAEKKLKKKAVGIGDPVEIVPIPEGEPMFMFQALKGKTKAVNGFYDSGCSNACLRAGIPGAQLHGQMLAKGPFNVSGVQGITIQAQDEWLVYLDRVDGRKQLLRGVTLPTITGPSPIFDIEQATRELKEDKPHDPAVQNLSVPKCVGGEVDILIGTLYNIIFPQPIHHLPNGLTIYSCTLASHDTTINATIGGPHTSFKMMADNVGGAASLMIHFIDGLEKFKKWGPPSVRDNPLICEELDMAKMMNSAEGDSVYEEVAAVEYAEEFIEELIEMEYATPDGLLFQQIISTAGDSAYMAVCECKRLCESLNSSSSGTLADRGEAMFTDIEKISPLSRIKLLEDGGLNIEYRCVKCRDCPDCRNAEDTEKISLREEAEMHMIKESVKLDLPNKRIICTLPVRGPERDFLSTNRDRALKVLTQQCNKYHKDEEVKEVAVKAFKKLFDNGHAALVEDVDEETKKLFINKDPQYFIPWRLVFKPDSLSTPCRAVLDGSSRTKFRMDGSAGRCLNDLVVKGKITSINLVKMLLRFRTGKFGVTCDLQQFYNSCKLLAGQWNLQRFLYRENMNPDNPVLEGVIMTLIYGVKSVSCQSEHALKLLADLIRDKYPAVAVLLEEGRYVDDEGESKATIEECYKLIAEAEETFALVNLKVKEWTVSGQVPSEKVSKDGASLDIAGLKWFPVLDNMETKIPLLHFGSKTRGRLSSKVKVFDSFGLSPADMYKKIDEFTPDFLTRRLTASKRASIFDIVGNLAPVLIKSSVLLRETIKATVGWDDAMPSDLRSRWLKEFILWEQLRGIQFSRAIMPLDAIDTKMRVIVAADSANPAMMIGSWGGFRKTDETWSCQLMLGRALLTAEDSTIPKNELTALTGGSNMAWLLRNALKEWVDHFILIGDSVIALCWVTADKKQLSLFHRNRVLQIRRGTELDKMYHVDTKHNPSDIGTRPDLVTLEDVKANSKWTSGCDWMRQDVDEAVKTGILKPVSELRLKTKQEQDDFTDGCVFDMVPEVLTRGHVLNQRRISLIQERASYSQYLLLPTKFSFRKTVRIYSYVFSFISKLRNAVRRRKGQQMAKFSCEEAVIKFSVFLAIEEIDDLPTLTTFYYFAEFTAAQSPPGYFALSQTVDNAGAAELTERFVNLSLNHLYRKAASEVKQFNSKKLVEKISVEQDNILFSKNRILDGMSFAELGDLQLSDLPVMGVKAHVPIIDRHSPLAYSIGQHIHWNVAHHKGIESCNRFSLQNCSILQGMSLYKELAEDCMWCTRKRKKLIEVSMGPISDHQLSIAPPFWCAQVDLFGPLFCYVPGHERKTRRTAPAQVKTWILTTVCEVTKLVNCQVIEKSDSSGILDGMTRLGCEVGVPSILLCDQGSNLMKAIRETEVPMINLKLQFYEEKGIKFDVCSVGGHNEHGLVERVIRSLQESMEESGLKNQRLTATGLQTLAKLVENDHNNIPLGFKFDRDQDNTEVLKIITPNMMRLGRINTRALSGPLRLPHGASEMVEKVNKAYEAWFKIWSESYVQKLLFKPKWFKDDTDLKIGDLVYFQRSESELGNGTWSFGMISAIDRSRDGLIRKVTVKYRNALELEDRETFRSARKLCKLWSEDDWNLQDDLAELAVRLKGVVGDQVILDQVQHAHLGVHHVAFQPPDVVPPAQPQFPTDACCCSSHCRLIHQHGTPLRTFHALNTITNLACDLDPQLPCFKAMPTEFMDKDPMMDPALDNWTDFLLNFNLV